MLKVISLNFVAHPLADNLVIYSQVISDLLQAKLEGEIAISYFLLNDHGDPIFLMHKFNYIIILRYFFECDKEHIFGILGMHAGTKLFNLFDNVHFFQ